MLDTIKLAWLLTRMPSPNDLLNSGWWAHYHEFSRELLSWSFKEKSGSMYHRLSLIKIIERTIYVTVRVSLPAFVNSSNARLIDEPEVLDALKELWSYVSDKLGKKLLLAQASVWEVHFTRDIYFGEENIAWAIDSLACMSITGLDRGRYSQQSLYFHSKGKGKTEKKPRTLCIYPKKADCVAKKFPQADIDSAEGKIRIEFRYRTRAAVKQLMRHRIAPTPCELSILTNHVSKKILDPIENQMTVLLDRVMSGDPIATRKEKYGSRRASTLIAFLVHLQRFGDDFYKQKALGYSRSAYFLCLKQCRDAGVFRLSDRLSHFL